MVEIPDSLCSVFTATIQERDGTYVVEIPSEEINHDAVSLGETYRVAVLGLPATTRKEQDSQSSDHVQSDRQRYSPKPPVDNGEVRDVTIETIGEQGDGIAKVERGYVVIVPNVEPGDEPTVKIEQVQENVAFASVIDTNS